MIELNLSGLNVQIRVKIKKRPPIIKELIVILEEAFSGFVSSIFFKK
jgi:hypothetical protein